MEPGGPSRQKQAIEALEAYANLKLAKYPGALDD
jgi:hypothetical protein